MIFEDFNSNCISFERSFVHDSIFPIAEFVLLFFFKYYCKLFTISKNAMN
jgi:hypothetical protein